MSFHGKCDHIPSQSKLLNGSVCRWVIPYARKLDKRVVPFIPKELALCHGCEPWCCLQDLMESLDSLLCGDSSESLKSLCLKLLLCLVTVSTILAQQLF